MRDFDWDEPLPLTWEGYHAYCRENPTVFPTLDGMMLERLRLVPGRFSMAAAVAALRWQTSGVFTRDRAGWKLNDHWSPFHARWFITMHPQHHDRLELRISLADIGWHRPPTPYSGPRHVW